MTTWRDVPQPPAIAALPKDPRGFPILFTARPTGWKPGDAVDFRVFNTRHALKALREHLCGVCGNPTKDYWFVGGPMCLANRIFGDPPMHEACARYALQVCPFLSRDVAYNLKRIKPGTKSDPNVIQQRPPYMLLLRTPGYQVLTREPDGRPLPKPLARINPWSSCTMLENDGSPTTDRFAIIQSVLGTAFYCFRCIERGKNGVSFNPYDAANLYCASCKTFYQEDPVAAHQESSA